VVEKIKEENMQIEKTANDIFKVINTFQDSIPKAVEFQKWSQLQIPNQQSDDEPPVEYEEFEDLEKYVHEIVTNFKGKAKDQIEEMLVQMNDTQFVYFQEKAKHALLAVNYFDLYQHFRECYPNNTAE
jgi:hypothetical protein